ncbi:MAG: tripartite tricarboxylate transporter substrate-binding protein [Betaproteobacteria bacterium]
MNAVLRAAFTVLTLAALLAAPAGAQDFPTRMVRLIVPFPPGGATDTLTRLIAEKLSDRWQQTVVVENKPGANTAIGTDLVAKSAADGHVLGVVTGAHVTNPLLGAPLPYDTLKDLTGVMLMTRFHMALYAHPSLPASTPRELLELAKQKGAVAYASATTQSYLGMALLAGMSGTQMQYIPYKGSAPALNDLLGGHVKLMIDPVLQSTLDHVKSGRIKLIGTLGSQPAELTPGAPAFGQVVRGYDFSGVFGLVARAGTAPALLQRIRNDIAAVMRTPEVAERVRAIGQEAVISTPEEYNAYILAEMKKWAPVVQATGAKLN